MLVYLKIFNKHIKYIFEILKVLTKVNLQLKSKKCEFHIIKINFLKFIIILKGIHIVRRKNVRPKGPS